MMPCDEQTSVCVFISLLSVIGQVEAEQEERYFMELEKKEKYEDKMQSTMSVRCTVFTCKNVSQLFFS